MLQYLFHGYHIVHDRPFSQGLAVALSFCGTNLVHSIYTRFEPDDIPVRSTALVTHDFASCRIFD